MKSFLFIATDLFAAEVLGRVAVLSNQLSAATMEQQVYLWASIQQAPSKKDYWSTDFPTWTASLAFPFDEAKYGGAGLELDRATLSADYSDYLLEDSQERQLQQLTRVLPARLVGQNVPLEQTIIIVSSLADPGGSAVLAAFLKAIPFFRRRGQLTCPIYAVAALGAATALDSLDSTGLRVVAAQSLLDIEKLFSRKLPAIDMAVPIYLTGEASVLNAIPDRSSQVSAASFLTVGMIQSIARNHVSPKPGTPDPFQLLFQADGSVLSGDSEFDCSRPFTTVGTYAVWNFPDRLAKLFSAWLARDAFAKLAVQKGHATLKECARLRLPDDVAAILDEVASESLRPLWDRIAEKRSIPWKEGSEAVLHPKWFDIAKARELFGSIFKEKDWARVTRNYGEPRLRLLPLETWDAALDELQELIDQGILPRRKRQITLLLREILEQFREGIEESIGKVFAKTFTPPVGAEPHLWAQALLGRIYNQLQEEQEKLEGMRAAASPLEVSEEQRSKDVQAARDELRKALSAVPSPVAVFLRMLAVFSLPLCAVLVFPADLGWFDAPIRRLLLGATLGVFSSTCFFARFVVFVRQRVFKSVSEWFSHYNLLLEEKDNRLRETTYSELLEYLVSGVEWLFDGKSDDPPSPELPKVFQDERDQSPPPNPDVWRAQQVLSGFQPGLAQAVESFTKRAEQAWTSYQPSLRETLLPENDKETIDLYCEMVGARADGIDWLAHTLSNLDPASLVPYRGGAAGDPPAWRRKFVLPSGEELLNDDVRGANSAFSFLHALESYFIRRLSRESALSEFLTQYLARSGAQAFSNTELYRRYETLALNSVESNTHPPAQRTTYMVAAGPGDLLAINCGWRPQAESEGPMSVHLELCSGIGTSDVLYYPSRTEPVSLLSRAWRTHAEAPFRGKALSPISGEQEVTS